MFTRHAKAYSTVIFNRGSAEPRGNPRVPRNQRFPRASTNGSAAGQ